MLRLRASVEAERAAPFGDRLRELDGVRRLVSQPDEAGEAGAVVFVADVEPAAADRLVEAIAELGIGIDDYLLTRVEVVAPQQRHLGGDSGIEGFAWVEVMGQARANSRPLARYLALINVAAVIAALGVITSSSILIVGAMAVSPDLLPICATCVGLVGRRRGLAQRSFVTLTLGLTLVVVTATVLAAALKGADLLPAGFTVEDSSLSTLAKTDYSTVLIALAAGIAAMLSFETRASAAVGVAISVTTIPASAYLGVALGAGGAGQALGALVVLLVNVSLLIFSGSMTLVVQRWLTRRAGIKV
ncbi:MAG TPA: DUF389 domain-containing protein [Solirubrobacterales bacterium]|jgi:uncharacterized hydrophobic protein (TIGR00271 family)|nr:DUF389 domain-containing protein [Solirubrobacterales bacterium]